MLEQNNTVTRVHDLAVLGMNAFSAILLTSFRQSIGQLVTLQPSNMKARVPTAAQWSG